MLFWGFTFCGLCFFEWCTSTSALLSFNTVCCTKSGPSLWIWLNMVWCHYSVIIKSGAVITTVKAAASKQPKYWVMLKQKQTLSASSNWSYLVNSNILFGHAIEARFSLQPPLAELLACHCVSEPGATSKSCSQQEVGGARATELSWRSRLPFHPDLCWTSSTPFRAESPFILPGGLE